MVIPAQTNCGTNMTFTFLEKGDWTILLKRLDPQLDSIVTSHVAPIINKWLILGAFKVFVWND